MTTISWDGMTNNRPIPWTQDSMSQSGSPLGSSQNTGHFNLDKSGVALDVDYLVWGNAALEWVSLVIPVNSVPRPYVRLLEISP